MAYRKNESDKQIDDLERAAADSTVVVNSIGGNTKNVGSPTGAGDNRTVSKAGVVVSHDDKLNVINAKAGKRRTSDSN